MAPSRMDLSVRVSQDGLCSFGRREEHAGRDRNLPLTWDAPAYGTETGEGIVNAVTASVTPEALRSPRDINLECLTAKRTDSCRHRLPPRTRLRKSCLELRKLGAFKTALASDRSKQS